MSQTQSTAPNRHPTKRWVPWPWCGRGQVRKRSRVGSKVWVCNLYLQVQNDSSPTAPQPTTGPPAASPGKPAPFHLLVCLAPLLFPAWRDGTALIPFLNLSSLTISPSTQSQFFSQFFYKSLWWKDLGACFSLLELWDPFATTTQRQKWGRFLHKDSTPSFWLFLSASSLAAPFLFHLPIFTYYIIVIHGFTCMTNMKTTL